MPTNNNSTIKCLIYLISCVINGITPSSSLLLELDLHELYEEASRHQTIILVAEALKNARINDSYIEEKSQKNILALLLLEKESKKIQDALEQREIWFMPLKGIILRNYYPQKHMRQMSDNDILYDASRSKEVQLVMESFGYKLLTSHAIHQDDYRKPPFFHFEMHKMLFYSNRKFHDYYQHIEQKLVGTTYRKRFTNEDFYIYMIAHEYMHYYRNGTGLRSLLDTYVFLKQNNENLKWKYIKSEIQKLGIMDFEKKNRELSLKVFSSGNIDDLDKEELDMLSCFIASGAYGTEEQGIINRLKRDGKVKYLLHKAFLSMDEIEKYYSFFYKHKIFLPILPIYRIIKKWNKIKHEMSLIIKTEISK